MERAATHLRNADGIPRVVFVGCVGRTQYSDIDLMETVMEILRSVAMYQPVRGGHFGFDLCVEECCKMVGLVPITVTEAGSGEQLSGLYQRPLEVLDSAALVVAFPPEPKPAEPGEKKKAAQPRLSVVEADPAVVETAFSYSIPVLAVRRDGETELYE